MRVDGIQAKTVKKWRATTDSGHPWPVATNALNRQFHVEQPNRVWAGDLTYVWTAEGWLYLAVVLDLYSRLVIGWAMGHRLTVALAERALTMALVKRPPPPDVCITRIAAASTPHIATSRCSPRMASRPA